MRVFVGTCGFPVSRGKVYNTLDSVEIQETFYNRPNPEKLRRLRLEAPKHFIFNMKAWQALTHPPTMPTWRRSKDKIPKDKSHLYGFLRPTKENFNAWEEVVKGAKELNARVIVLQLPSAFRCNDENIRNMREFLSSITPSKFLIGIEVRGEWKDKLEVLRSVIKDIKGVIHVVDPLRYRPALVRSVSYFRLHGLGGSEVNYRYKYTDEDLKKLKDILADLRGRSTEAYVMFNNVYMYNDALRFKNILKA